MSVFLDTSIEDARNNDILIKALNASIEINECYNEYMKDQQLVYEAEEPEKSGKFMTAIKKIWRRIRQFISDFIGIFKNAFSKKENVTVDDYMNSSQVQTELEQKADEIATEVENEVLEGKRIISMISNHTGIDPRIINDYCNKAQEFAPQLIAPAGVALTSRRFWKKHSKGVGKTQKAIDEMNKMIENGQYNTEEKRWVMNIANGVGRYTTQGFSKIGSAFKDVFSRKEEE